MINVIKENRSYFFLIAAIVVADQLTKYWAEFHLKDGVIVLIESFFDFSLVHNYGAAFGILANFGGMQKWFFLVLALTVSIYLVYEVSKLKSFERHLKLAYCLIIAGALGNAIDRVVYGYVVDFIHFFYVNWHFPSFNIADMAISIGAFLIILEAFGKPILNYDVNVNNNVGEP